MAARNLWRMRAGPPRSDAEPRAGRAAIRAPRRVSDGSCSCFDALHALGKGAQRPAGSDHRGPAYLSTPNLAGWVPRFHWYVFRPLTGIWPHPEPPLHLYQFAPATVRRLFAAAGFERVRFLPDEIPLWYTSGFLGEPGLRHWLRGEPRVRWTCWLYLTTLPVFLAARVFNRGDSMVVSDPSRRAQINC